LKRSERLRRRSVYTQNIMKILVSFFAISGCVKDGKVRYKEELDFLLILRLQRFDKSQIMNV
jgi:hypothetical protein